MYSFSLDDNLSSFIDTHFHNHNHNSLLCTQATTAFASGIAHYEVAVGTFPGAQDVVARHSVGEATAYLLTNASLRDGQAYYATVWATDLVGLQVGFGGWE